MPATKVLHIRIPDALNEELRKVAEQEALPAATVARRLLVLALRQIAAQPKRAA